MWVCEHWNFLLYDCNCNFLLYTDHQALQAMLMHHTTGIAHAGYIVAANQLFSPNILYKSVGRLVMTDYLSRMTNPIGTAYTTDLNSIFIIGNVDTPVVFESELQTAISYDILLQTVLWLVSEGR